MNLFDNRPRNETLACLFGHLCEAGTRCWSVSSRRVLFGEIIRDSPPVSYELKNLLAAVPPQGVALTYPKCGTFAGNEGGAAC